MTSAKQNSLNSSKAQIAASRNDTSVRFLKKKKQAGNHTCFSTNTNIGYRLNFANRVLSPRQQKKKKRYCQICKTKPGSSAKWWFCSFHSHVHWLTKPIKARLAAAWWGFMNEFISTRFKTVKSASLELIVPTAVAAAWLRYNPPTPDRQSFGEFKISLGVIIKP